MPNLQTNIMEEFKQACKTALSNFVFYKGAAIVALAVWEMISQGLIKDYVSYTTWADILTWESRFSWLVEKTSSTFFVIELMFALAASWGKFREQQRANEEASGSAPRVDLAAEDQERLEQYIRKNERQAQEFAEYWAGARKDGEENDVNRMNEELYQAKFGYWKSVRTLVEEKGQERRRSGRGNMG